MLYKTWQSHGSGKSVLIKCIVGLLQYDDGSLKVFGKKKFQRLASA